MISALLQIAVISLLAIGFYAWRANLRRRNSRSWDSLVARLQLDCGTQRLSDPSIQNGNLNLTPQEHWRLVRGAFGLWAMYENAAVMMEMADYATRNSDSVDRDLLAGLRADAMQIRVCVLTALAKYAFSQVNENISINIIRAAAAYTEMAARTTELLRASGQEMVPSFVAAM